MRYAKFAVGALCSLSNSALAETCRPLTVQAGIEAPRILHNYYTDDSIIYSPSGRYYLVRTFQGSIARNGTEVSFFLGSRSNLALAANPRSVARIFTTTPQQLPPRNANSKVVWLAGERAIAFLWNDGTSPTQVVSLNLETGHLSRLTHHDTDITTFNISANGDVITYRAIPRRDPDIQRERMRRGFAIEDTNLINVLRGESDSVWTDSEVYLQTPTGRTRISSPTDSQGRYDLPPLVSGDGSYLASTGNAFSNMQGAASPPGRDRVSVYDISSATATELASINLGSRTYPLLAWSPQRTLAIIVPVTRRSGSSPASAQVFIYEPGRGTRPIATIPGATSVRDLSLTWLDSNQFAVANETSGNRYVYHRGPGARWLAGGNVAVSQVTLSVVQDANTPPKIVAHDNAAGGEATVFDTGTYLRNYCLGSVTEYTWTDSSNLRWRAKLYLPVGWRRGERSPLVIQTHGESTDTFGLLGDDANTAVFAAQALANRGYVVLQMVDAPDPPDREYSRSGAIDYYASRIAGTADEGPITMRSYESAVDALNSAGLIDVNRVGLIGWSRTGYQVQYAISHSDFHFGAAIIADNVDAGYMQSLIYPYLRDEYIRMNGGVRRGESAMSWVQRSAAFNAEKVHTPLRIELDYGGGMVGILQQWEFFQQLRYNRKPVELYVIPDIEQGSHAPVRPDQQIASQQGTVDWMDFWLNGNVDPDPSKADQYQRWERLKSLQQSEH